MARVSLGVILNGRPDCVQETTPFVKILEFLCRWAWIAGLVGMISCFVISFVADDGMKYIYGIGRWAGMGVLMYFVSYCIWDEKHRCEYCHHFFSLRRISENVLIGSSEKSISRSTIETDGGMAFDSRGNSATYTTISSGREYGTEVTKNYTYNVRCRCCGAVCKVETSKTSQHY